VLKPALLLGALASLAACSRRTPLVIAAIGDSTMWRHAIAPTAGRVAVTEPQALQENLRGTAVVRTAKSCRNSSQ
jgi:hypothetical protein